MNERGRNIAVGLTALAGMVGLGVTLMLFGYAPSILLREYPVTVYLPDSGGLSAGSRVRMHHIDIGRIESVRLDEPAQRGVIVDARISREYLIPAGASARIEQSSLLGGSASLIIDLSAVPEDQSAMLSTDGDAIIRGQAPRSIQESVIAGMTPVLQPVVDEIRTLSATWTQVGQRIAVLVGEVEEGDTQVVTVRQTLAQLDEQLAQISRVVEGVNAIVNDEAFQRNVKQAAADISGAAGDVAEVAEAANETLTQIQQQTQRITAQTVAVADDLSRLVRAANQTVDSVNAGDGSLGRLLRDPTLYNSLRDAAQRADAAIAELENLLEKFQEEGVPIRVGQ